MTIEAKKLSLIEQILSLEDEQVLDAVADTIAAGTEGDIAAVVEDTVESDNYEQVKLNPRDAVGGIRENVTLEQLKKEQNYTPITYEEFQKIASEIDWGDITLDELLAALN
jgi:hypothetical protein